MSQRGSASLGARSGRFPVSLPQPLRSRRRRSAAHGRIRSMVPAGRLRMLAALGAALALALPAAAHAAPPAGLDRIRHIIVLYMENHSFDNLFGGFPGADGLAAA